MMPFGKISKGFSAHSGDEDRKNVIKQMKVRAIIKADKSWIHKPNDTEGHTIELPPSKEHCPAVPPLTMARKDRTTAIKPIAGYIIRGVFTKPIDSTSLPQSKFPTTFEKPKRSTIPSKSLTASLPQLSDSSYKINTDDFSKKMTEAVEEETLLERSKTLPALARQLFGLNRSSTWSTDSNHGSTGSKHDLDEEVTSKKGTSFLYSDRFISSTQGEAHDDPAKLQPIEHKKLSQPDMQPQESKIREMPLVSPVPRECRIPYWNLARRFCSEECGAFSPDDQYNHSMNLQYCVPIKNTAKYTSAPTVNNEKRYSAKPDDEMLPESRRFAAPSVGTDNQRFETLPRVEDMMTSDHRRSISTSEERTSMDGMAASAQDGASLLDCEPSSNANKSIFLVKEYMNVREPQYTRPSLRLSKMSGDVTCTYCCKEIRSEPKIILEHLGICCHEYCFKCGICKRKMGNMLDQVYIHNGIIHCEQCYSRLY